MEHQPLAEKTVEHDIVDRETVHGSSGHPIRSSPHHLQRPPLSDRRVRSQYGGNYVSQQRNKDKSSGRKALTNASAPPLSLSNIKIQRHYLEDQNDFRLPYPVRITSDGLFIKEQDLVTTSLERSEKSQPLISSGSTKLSSFEDRDVDSKRTQETWMDQKRHRSQAYEYLCHIAEARQWMENFIGPTRLSNFEFEEALRDGVMLAEFVQELQPLQKVRVFRHSKLQFRHSDNIAIFLRYLADIGLAERFKFDLVDLYEKKNISKVVYCVHALAHHLYETRQINEPIKDMLGELQLADDELEEMQGHLDQAGLTLPKFSELRTTTTSEVRLDLDPVDASEKIERELKENKLVVVELQSQMRGALTRVRLNEIMDSLWGFEESLIQFQSLVRGRWAREISEYREAMRLFAIKLQSVARGCIIRRGQQARMTWWKESEEKVVVLQRLFRKRRSKLRSGSFTSSVQDSTVQFDLRNAFNRINRPLEPLMTSYDKVSMLITQYISKPYLDLLETWSRCWEPPLTKGKTRIRWTCRCNKKLWDDFVELKPGAAAELCRDLHHYEKSQVRTPQGPTNDAQERNTSERTSVTHLMEEGDLGLSDLVDISSRGNQEPSQSGNAAIGGITPAGRPPVGVSNPKKEFLLLCFKRKNDTLRLSQLDIAGITNDFHLFNMLKVEYKARKGALSRLSVPRKVVSVNFRKFERHPRDRVVILSAPDILPQRVNPDACHKDHQSPKCDTTYDIHPTPPDLDPYIGRNGLAHLLEYPHEAEEQGNNLPAQTVWLRRFPKKEKTKLMTCPPYQYGLGWGVEFEEAWCLSRLIKLTTSVLILAATIFLICWWKFRGDLQGAAGMAGFLISCSAALIALLSALALG